MVEEIVSQQENNIYKTINGRIKYLTTKENAKQYFCAILTANSTMVHGVHYHHGHASSDHDCRSETIRDVASDRLADKSRVSRQPVDQLSRLVFIEEGHLLPQ